MNQREKDIVELTTRLDKVVSTLSTEDNKGKWCALCVLVIVIAVALLCIQDPSRLMYVFGVFCVCFIMSILCIVDTLP